MSKNKKHWYTPTKNQCFILGLQEVEKIFTPKERKVLDSPFFDNLIYNKFKIFLKIPFV